MAQFYQKKIMQHYLQPRNRVDEKMFMSLSSSRSLVKLSGGNPSCGDRMEIALKVGKQQKIEEVWWHGSGCVISQAATSMLSEMILSQTFPAVRKSSPAKFLKEFDIQLSPLRMKCALLPLMILQGRIDSSTTQ